MPKVSIEELQRHIKTHTERSDDDVNAVTTLKYFLTSGGKVNSNFSERDKWPNTDGTLELVPNPDDTRRPKQNFVVQIKGTKNVRVSADGIVKYQLQSLAFPAYVATEVTLDPGILFLVLNPGERGKERVFWKYISAKFIASINFGNDSATIDFLPDDEILNTVESVNEFVVKLDNISNTHSYIKQLEAREYTKDDIIRSIVTRCKNISEDISYGTILNFTRDKLSQKIFIELDDLCKCTLLLNGLQYYEVINLRTAWELSLFDIKTKFLATFLQGLKYIGLRVPEEGQYERLLLKYYGFLWRIREYLYNTHNLIVLQNLEDFPRDSNDEDREYNQLLAAAIDSVGEIKNPICQNRYYLQKKTTFYVGTQRYFELTLQLADKYATKYNRITVYSKCDISTNYSIQVGYTETDIVLWDNTSKIKIITNWKVSIEPASLNKLSKAIRMETKLSSNYNEYASLMSFLTHTGINLLDFIDFHNNRFNYLIDSIYNKTNTSVFKDVLILLHSYFNNNSSTFGKNTIRFALINLREDLLENIFPGTKNEVMQSSLVYLSKKCYAFECNPILYNLPYNKTNGKTISNDVLRAIGTQHTTKYLPYIRMKYLIDSTGELFYTKKDIEYNEDNQTIAEYNSQLTEYDKNQGRSLLTEDDYVYLEEFVNDTVFILKKLLDSSSSGNEGQEQINREFIDTIDLTTIDEVKVNTLQNIFVDSKVLMLYGAAGTGKTTLMNYISELMKNRSKLFLAKTHTALENLKRRITSTGYASEFYGLDQFINFNIPADYDIIFVDECSTIDNRTMVQLLKKIGNESLLVFAGDIYQIESIDFGNWFFYAKEILSPNAITELNCTWRTQKTEIKKLWDEVRFLKPLITEMLVIDGPFSECISKNIFVKQDNDEVVLCLNYDGKFGLNSINNYFQDANPSKKVFYWFEWKYKIGDPILFNENKRFPMLYNNLKGTIVDIESDINSIKFTIDIPITLTAVDVRGTDLTVVSRSSKSSRICFTIYANDGTKTDEDYEDARMKSIVPFQLAYAVSIHKAQGLEYNSIKVIIPNSNSEHITHDIFYTAITRTKEKLKIYWSSDTMQNVISGFNTTNTKRVSLELIQKRLELN